MPPRLKTNGQNWRGGIQKRRFVSFPKLFPSPPLDPRRKASTTANQTDWLAWLRKKAEGGGQGGKALLFAGLGSYPHTPHSPTPSSLAIWEQASEALLTPDTSLLYDTKGMEEFAGILHGTRGVRGWMRGWVKGRTLDELMLRADVTAAFILSSSIAILASEQEHTNGEGLIPSGVTHLVGHGFIGTLTALVAAGRIDLPTGVRLARMYASLPASPEGENRKFMTTVLSARQFHSLSHPEDWTLEGNQGESSSAPERRRRAMQLILDEIHEMQREWEKDGQGEWAEAGIINSSKVLVVTGTHDATSQVITRLQVLGLANEVMDVPMPCPFNTRLMVHAQPLFRDILSRAQFNPSSTPEITVMDPCTTQPIGHLPQALETHLCSQVRWHKTLSQLCSDPLPQVGAFYTVGKGAKGLGVMLRGEIKRRVEGAPEIEVREYGREEEDEWVKRKLR
ncbi:hypothetical protein M231_04403 [Tremella mesenterica]|uniref:[acyl-carrier-protein] S-malonyltransferase n=1 Tax=Tremella mesenterica TaxID=5217 RepID=A0A4Q1BKS0_TREME|nr:uncharacterized protein TREMEDRAFT_62421 [Tremella mesenterica DSM 1558]EIW69560.1 hypothetical protein TREMEDRAFT_62421 [Tremella mesenterica DSM 1558]RXK38361.1 hypothetical protein M231_04403 [Tremella mesenterica]